MDQSKPASASARSANLAMVRENGGIKSFGFDTLDFPDWRDMLEDFKAGEHLRVTVSVEKVRYYTDKDFKEATGEDWQHDDLERCNCLKAGMVGHHACGWCEKCNGPRFMCGHLLFNERSEEDTK